MNRILGCRQNQDVHLPNWVFVYRAYLEATLWNREGSRVGISRRCWRQSSHATEATIADATCQAHTVLLTMSIRHVHCTAVLSERYRLNHIKASAVCVDNQSHLWDHLSLSTCAASVHNRCEPPTTTPVINASAVCQVDIHHPGGDWLHKRLYWFTIKNYVSMLNCNCTPNKFQLWACLVSGQLCEEN